MKKYNEWLQFLNQGLHIGAYPCYAAAVGDQNQIFFRAIGGDRAVYPQRLPLQEDTLFDMASMTKMIGTTCAALRLIDRGRLRLEDPLNRYFDDCRDKGKITVRQLMTHSSGLPAHLPLWQTESSPDTAVDAILRCTLRAAPDTKVIYSCMGYILLGKLLERLCGMPLDVIVAREVLQPLGMLHSCFCPPQDAVCAATEKKVGRDDYICGHVHDENAYFLGGVSGNAGLFCPLDDGITFATMLSRRAEGYLSEELFALAIRDLTPFDPDESRGLGFHLYRDGTYPGGSCMSRGSYGHTGYTGTTLYVDRDTGVYCLLLTNRVHYGRDTEAYFPHRRAFFDLVYRDTAGNRQIRGSIDSKISN